MDFILSIKSAKNIISGNFSAESEFIVGSGIGNLGMGLGKAKVSPEDIRFSDKFSKPAYKNQIVKRGWSNESIANTINNPVKLGSSVNKYTGNPVTLYYIDDIHYVAVDNITNKAIQVADMFDPNWVADLLK
ncbi:hypothetical protein DVW05_16720 [Clostridium botulinum]|uniref:colicin E5-related ribonuclease n=1 Tax=Clostridium sp. ZBS18 TaxID=2949967 RepID=UPI0002FD476F|nr:hypothetical protein [Clostridium botulinum]